MDNNIRLKQAHIKLIRSRDTYAYSAVMLLGESALTDNPEIPQAAVKGLDKYYNNEYVSTLTDAQLRGVIMHETLHVALMHTTRFTPYLEDENDAQLMAMAMDIQVNNMICKFEDKQLCELPEPTIVMPKYDGWDTLDIFYDLRKNQPPPPPSGGKGNQQQKQGKTGFDQHSGGAPKPGNGEDGGDDQIEGAMPQQQQIEEMQRQIRDALHQGGTLAGLQGHGMARDISMALAPPHNWADEVSEFLSVTTAGSGESSYEKYNRKRVIDDLYLPTNINETISEMVFAVDTSGSISQQVLSKVAAVIATACAQIKPERVRVLFWDTNVAAEQVFTENYENIASVLKPAGGGGTRVSCVAEYIVKRKLNPDCIVVLTDGYVEDNINWPVKCPSLWVITEDGTESFSMPHSGRFVRINRN